MRLLLDTSAMIALKKGDERVKGALEERKERVDDVGIRQAYRV